MGFFNWLQPASGFDDPLGWSRQKFFTRARTLFYARLGFLSLGLLILAIPRWAEMFGMEGPIAPLWYLFMVSYSVLAFLLLERSSAGKLIAFITMCLDLLALVYMIAFTGGLSSPVLPSQIVYTILFALMFPNPLAILPPLLVLPIVAKIDSEIPGRLLRPEEIFLLVWYSVINFVVVYVMVYLHEREDSLHNEIVSLQENLKQMALVDERNRLSREIHDGLGASLSSLIIQAEYLNGLTQDEVLKAEIHDLKSVAEESIDELRRSLSLMRNNFDLVPALEDYCTSFRQRSRVPLDLEVVGRVPRLDPEKQMALFRVLQESLTNARKHAQARQVKVSLTRLADELHLMIQDDGQGFDPQVTPRGHYGLISMRERAKQYGGQIDITSSPGNGCRVLLRLPLGQGDEPSREITQSTF